MDDRLLDELRAEIERLKTRLGEVERHSWRRAWARVAHGADSSRVRWAVLAVAVIVPVAAYATVIVPNTFVNATIADADQVNANFTALADEINLHEADAAEHHAKTTDASELTAGTLPDARLSPTVSLLGSGVSVAELEFDPGTQAELDAHTGVFGLHALDPSAHHSRYGDAEAIAAVGSHVTSVDGLTGGTISGAVQVNGLISSSAGGVRFPDATIQTTAAGVLPNRILVAPSGGDFTTIQAAIDSVTPTAGNPYLIDIAAGTYPEDLVLKSYLHLRGAGIGATVITPVSASPHLLLASLASVKLSQLTLFDDTAVGTPITTGIFATASSLELVDLQIEGYQAWQVLVESGSSLRARRVEFETGLQAETAIRIAESDADVADSRFHVQSCAIDVAEGSLALTRSELDSISDAFDVCAGNASPGVQSISLIGNRLVGGVRVGDEFETRITGNDIGGRILLGSSLSQTEIAANRIGFLGVPDGLPTLSITSGVVEIVGNTIEGGSGGAILNAGVATISGNRVTTVGGGVGITNTGTATIVSNYVRGGSIGILDQGEAMIMGNKIEGATLGLDVSGATTPTVVVGNRITGTFSPEPPEHWVSDREVRIESTANNIVLVSGGSTVTVTPAGDVTIQGANDINFTAVNDINLSAGGTIDLSGANVTIKATNQATVSAGGLLNMTGSLINLN